MAVAMPAFAGELFRQQAGVEREPGEWVVVFNDEEAANLAATSAAASVGATVERVWSVALNGALITGIDESQAAVVAALPTVRWVEPNLIAYAVEVQPNPPNWGLDRIDQDPLPLDQSYTFNFDGTGVHAYVIDTGMRRTHQDFGNRASHDFTSINDGNGANDCNGHGTHVSGILGSETFGVAKNVRLHAVRVLNCGGSGTLAQVVDGIEFVTQNALFPAVANMSLAFGGVSPTADTAVNNSVAAGIFYAVAAGNNGSNACNFSVASADQAYAVGWTERNDTRNGLSNFGPCVNIFAPGGGIVSTWNASDTATNSLSGTSMASPHVAGVAALILDENPGLTVDQVKQEILRIATTGRLSNIGSGSPNLLVHSLTGGGGCEPTEPTETSCSDGLDNDCDGLTDGDDPDCDEDCIPTEDEEISCSDGVDNDCDGLVDEQDPDCAEDCVPTEDEEFSCSDGVDNDCDGLVDEQDPDCALSCLPDLAACSSNDQCCGGRCFLGILCF